MPTAIQHHHPASIESKDVALLVPELSEKVSYLKKLCLENGIELGIGCALRGPEAQAKLWCRSRTITEVRARRTILEKPAPLIASLLRDEYAELGPPATSHLPGASWHQWGEAVDVFARIKDFAVWEGSPARLIADLAKKVDLFHSYNEKSWEPKTRRWHIQLRKKETPLLIRGYVDTWSDVEAAMKEKFEFTAS